MLQSLKFAGDGTAPGAVKETPYWWLVRTLQPEPPREPPAKADVLIVGSGFTGLHAALALARAGRSVVVCDSGEIGSGASTRNAGFIGRVFKHPFVTLEKAHGTAHALAVYGELHEAFTGLTEWTRQEKLDCGLQLQGRFTPATCKADYDAMATELTALRQHFGFEFEMISKSRVHESLSTDLYEGGALVNDLGGLHPGLLHEGLVQRALDAGVQLMPFTTVTNLGVAGSGSRRVETSRGPVQAREVVVAVNGYPGKLLPWLSRRLIPFDAFMIATEEVPGAKLARAIPANRVVIDSSHNPLYVRRSSDGKRVLFGGYTGTRPAGADSAAQPLFAALQRLLPDLQGVRLGHAWTGRCAATFDLYPHVGTIDGVHFAGGYCFAGVTMSFHLGRKIAESILGERPARSVFAERSFPTRPLYSGNPWFVPAITTAYKFLDRRTRAGRLASR